MLTTSKPRDRQEYPTGVIQTKLGEVQFGLTDRRHVYLSVESGKRFSVRGVEYYATLHLYRDNVTGEWKPRDRESFYLSRGDYSDKQPAASTRQLIIDAFTDAWKAHVTADMLTDAEFADFNNKLSSLESQRNQLIEKLYALQTEWTAAHLTISVEEEAFLTLNAPSVL